MISIRKNEISDSNQATNLMPLSVKRKLQKSPRYSKEGLGDKADVVVKYFNPYGSGTWLITEGDEQENGDWMLFGMCHIFEWEWGYVLLSELKNMRIPPFGFRIERDLYSSGIVAELMDNSRTLFNQKHSIGRKIKC